MSWKDTLKKSDEDEYAKREAKERREEKAASYDKPAHNEDICPRCKKQPKFFADKYCPKCEEEMFLDMQEQIRNDPYGGDDFAAYNQMEADDYRGEW